MKNLDSKEISFDRDLQYYKFCMYGFLKNLRFFEPFFLLFFIETGLSFTQIGFLYAIREISINIFEIPSGIAADAIGRRKTMIFSFAAYIFSFLIFYFFSAYWLFVVAIIFFAIGDAFRTGTHKAMIFEYLAIRNWKPFKTHYYGHTRSWSQIGAAVSSLIGAALVFYTGNFRAIFLYSLIPYILDMLLMISYPKELDGDFKKKSFMELKKSISFIVVGSLHSLKQVGAIKGILNLSIYSSYYKVLKDYLQPIIRNFALILPVFLLLPDNQRTAIFIGVIYFFVYLLTSVASRNSGRIASYFRTESLSANRFLIIGFSLGIASGLFFILEIYAISIIFLTFVYIVENIRKPIILSHVSNSFGEHIQATVLSFQSQVQTLISALLAVLLGVLVDYFSIGIAIVIISTLLLIISGFVYITDN